MPNISVTTSAHSQHKDITVISVKGFIDTTTAPEFENAFQSVLGEKKFNLVIDLKDVNYISSVGWGIFIGEIKRIRNQNGNLFLAAMNPTVEETYDLLQFGSIFKSFPNVDQAVQNGFGKPRSAKGSPKSQSGKAIDAPRTAQPVAAAPIGKSAERPLMVQSPKKTHWFVRALLPWKWF